MGNRPRIPTYSINDRFTFGKYQGQRLSQIMKYDASYILWCVEKLCFLLDHDTLQEVEELADEQQEKEESFIRPFHEYYDWKMERQ